MCAPYSLGNDREFVTNERVSVIGEREREREFHNRIYDRNNCGHIVGRILSFDGLSEEA